MTFLYFHLRRFHNFLLWVLGCDLTQNIQIVFSDERFVDLHVVQNCNFLCLLPSWMSSARCCFELLRLLHLYSESAMQFAIGTLCSKGGSLSHVPGSPSSYLWLLLRFTMLLHVNGCELGPLFKTFAASLWISSSKLTKCYGPVLLLAFFTAYSWIFCVPGSDFYLSCESFVSQPF